MAKLTLNGVDVMGERLAEEEKSMRVRSILIFVTGGIFSMHSVGELIMSYCNESKHGVKFRGADDGSPANEGIQTFRSFLSSRLYYV